VHGVTVDLAKAAAAKLNLPLQLIQYRAEDEGPIVLAAEKDAWDISFGTTDQGLSQWVTQRDTRVRQKVCLNRVDFCLLRRHYEMV
jgi:hypothetical protein